MGRSRLSSLPSRCSPRMYPRGACSESIRWWHSGPTDHRASQETEMSDFKYAVRAFLRNPGFTAVVILTLGLGIGATTAIFSVVNAVLLRPLPYRDAGRLVATQASLPDYQDLAASTQAFDATASWASNLYNLATATETRQVLG